MSRCLQLAKLGAGNVAPNPMVGAILVYNDKIIGEGYHQQCGEAHAEVNCIASVSKENIPLIKESTLYVSLEPCSHFGKTPPCTNLIIKNKIKKVVIGCKDVYKEVSGKGIEKLQNAGVGVIPGILEKESISINKRFFTFHQKFRPYVILKWAQSSNLKVGSNNSPRILISNEYSNRLVHKWRGEEEGILVGTNTIIQDNPSLTTRLWPGKNPVRIIIDKDLKLSQSAKIFDREAKTIIYNLIRNSNEENVSYIKIEQQDFLQGLLQSLFELKIISILIEGGAKTLGSFIERDLWDEARVITNEELIIENGINAPEMKDFILQNQERYSGDRISYYARHIQVC
jgi:diaminohydroxyphosphoribosylaminopyrimidine deaminase/5-amino-6-(5-phosphoribosylamino)uracil reductase